VKALPIGLLLVSVTNVWADNVLLHRTPKLGGSAMLTDGQVNGDGAPWQEAGTTLLPVGEVVEWDLKDAITLTHAAIQADNNDSYVLSVSQDAEHWSVWWTAGPVESPGLQTRQTTDVVPVQARFVRLSGFGGDGRMSVSELEIFVGSTRDSVLLSPRFLPKHPLDIQWLGLVLSCWALLFLTSAQTPRRLLLALSVPVALWLLMVLRQSWWVPDVDAPRVNLMRAAAAMLALGAVARESWPRRPGNETLLNAVWGVSALAAVMCFLNLGRAQFFDVGKGQPTFLHHYDMRTYFPIAKYFDELRFDGVYAASVAAVAEDRGGIDSFSQQSLRDLRTHQVTTVEAQRAHIEAVKARFSPQRWVQFLSDMRYFRQAMGEGGFWSSMNDHGGNATPVWFLLARALFAGAAASDLTLWFGVWVDAALLLLALLALWNGFGWRTACLAATLFGAMDFYQFGSNWFGAALRHDWLSLWCLSLWALQTRRFRLAGFLIAWSALIRAFPALALVTLSMVVLHSTMQLLRRAQHHFSWREWMRVNDWMLRVLTGVLLAVLLLGGLSVLNFKVSSWGQWLAKVQLLDQEPHINNIAVRTYVTQSRPLWMLCVVGAVLVVLMVLRKREPPAAAAWGVALVPVVFNPANYYLHSMFLLSVLTAEGADAPTTWNRRAQRAVMLLMCVACFFTTFETSLSAHFQKETAVVLATLGMLGVLEGTRRTTSSAA
jgi:hypothetical protein